MTFIRSPFLFIALLFYNQNLLFGHSFHYSCTLTGLSRQENLDASLRTAAINADEALMEKLIQVGADVNGCFDRDQPHAGRMVLTEAIDSGSVGAVRLLLEHGAVVEEIADVPDCYNKLKPASRNVPQLSYAIMVNAPTEIIKLLITYSKDLNITDIYHIGWTAYKVAAFYEHYEAMALLEQAGADTDASIPVKVLSKK